MKTFDLATTEIQPVVQAHAIFFSAFFCKTSPAQVLLAPLFTCDSSM